MVGIFGKAYEKVTDDSDYRDYRKMVDIPFFIKSASVNPNKDGVKKVTIEGELTDEKKTQIKMIIGAWAIIRVIELMITTGVDYKGALVVIKTFQDPKGHTNYKLDDA